MNYGSFKYNGYYMNNCNCRKSKVRAREIWKTCPLLNGRETRVI